VTPFNLVKTWRSNDLHAFSPVKVWTPLNAAKQLKHCSPEDNSQSNIQYLFVSQLHHKSRLSLEIISVLIIYKSSFYGIENPGRGNGRAEINRYTTQTRQTNSQMAGKEEAMKQKCGRWQFQSGVDDDSGLMGKDDTSLSS